MNLPIDGLPEIIQNYIQSVSESYDFNPDFVTAAVFSTAATAVGQKLRVTDGRYENLMALWFCLVAPSGSNKSQPIRVVTRPLVNIDKRIYSSYREKLEAWRKTPAADRSDSAPRCGALVVKDCTDERRNEVLFLNTNVAIDNRHFENLGCLGIYPELKGMFDSKNQYQNAGTAPISRLLLLFDGEDLKIDRKNDSSMLVERPFFSVIGDLQTGLLRKTFGNELFMENGLNQRFLFCVDENPTFAYRNRCPMIPFQTQAWTEIVEMLFENVYHSPTGQHFSLFRNADGLLRLSPEADNAYNSYYNQLQDKKKTAGDGYESAIYSKMQIQVLRLAGIVHALKVAAQKGAATDYATVSAESMKYAIRCMDYFEYMAKLVYGKLVEQDDDLPSRAMMVKALKAYNPEIQQTEIAAALSCTKQYVSKVLKGG